MKQKLSRFAARSSFPIFNYVVLTCIAIMFTIPIVWSLKAAFLRSSDIFAKPLFDFSGPWTIENFSVGLKTVPFFHYFMNSVIVAGSSTIVILISSITAGYGFAYFEFRGKKILFVLVIASLLMPFQSIMIPLFIGEKQLHLIDTMLGIILPSTISAFGIFMMRQFLAGLPRELIDAAYIDGCGHFRAFLAIVLPLARAPLATLAAISFLGNWNNYLWPLIVAQTQEIYTLPIGLTMFRGNQGSTNYGYIFAASLFAAIPALIVFLVMRRSIIQSYALTGLNQ
jgi:multiple sugar transport system permease protein